MTVTVNTSEDKSKSKMERARIHRYTRRPANNDRFGRYSKVLMSIMKALDIVEYRSDRSNRIYSYRQKLALLIIRALMNLSYRDFHDSLGSYRGCVEAIGLDFIPHHPTLCKFAALVDATDVYRIINEFSRLCNRNCIMAMDSTGISNFDRSGHYVKRLDQLKIAEGKRTFTKLSTIVDCDSKVIVSARAAVGNRADITFVPEQVAEISDIGIDAAYFTADKGYDGESVHRFVRSSMGCLTVIPPRRSRGNRGFSLHGPHRRQMMDSLKPGSELKRIYDQRPQVETSNFMLKRKNGSFTLTRIDAKREFHVLFKTIAHNLRRVIDLGADWRFTI